VCEAKDAFFASAGAISAVRTPTEPTKINPVIRISGSPFETFRFQKKRFWRFLANGFTAGGVA
jgi:hypothetical protein